MYSSGGLVTLTSRSGIIVKECNKSGKCHWILKMLLSNQTLWKNCEFTTVFELLIFEFFYQSNQTFLQKFCRNGWEAPEMILPRNMTFFIFEISKICFFSIIYNKKLKY